MQLDLPSIDIDCTLGLAIDKIFRRVELTNFNTIGNPIIILQILQDLKQRSFGSID